MQRVFDNKSVSFALVWFFKTCVSCPPCARHCGRICDALSAHVPEGAAHPLSDSAEGFRVYHDHKRSEPSQCASYITGAGRGVLHESHYKTRYAAHPFAGEDQREAQSHITGE